MKLFKKKNLSIFSLLLLLPLALGMVGCSSSSSEEGGKEESKKVEETVYGVGDTFNYKDEYTIKINSVKTTKERNQFADEKVKNVVIINYTYENLNKDDDLFVDTISFKAYDSEGNAVDTYPADVKMPKGISKGKKCTAEMAFGVNEGDTIELEYLDNMFNSKKDALFKLKFK